MFDRIGYVSAVLTAVIVVLLLPAQAPADVCNIKVVTDANPDYTDLGSMIHSMTANWKEDRDKVWAVFYWNHVGRRQLTPIIVHGVANKDPIRQFNDYGYLMCDTIRHVDCGIFATMGMDVRAWDITNHGVMDVFYDDAWHMIDNSLSVLYTRCDGKTLASTMEIGAKGACEASGGKKEMGHIARYHCLYATGLNSYLQGSDCPRFLAGPNGEEGTFAPAGLKPRWYYAGYELGHRYSLNLRDGEVYTRHYSRLDAKSPNAVAQDKEEAYKADPDCFVPSEDDGKDAESHYLPPFNIRGNGLRTYNPALDDLARNAWSATGVQAAAGAVTPAKADQKGEVAFRVEGANAITSMKIFADLFRKADADQASISVSVNNGVSWKEVYKADKTGDLKAEVKLNKEVNSRYDLLVKVSLMGKAAPADAALKNIRFETITQITTKTQPLLKIGKNTVFVGAGAPTQSIVIWPDLQAGKYKETVYEEKNIFSQAKHPEYMGVLGPDKAGEPAYLVYRIDAPQELTTLTAGGRFYIRDPKGSIELLYSVDEGKTWTSLYKCEDSQPPYDIVKFVRADIPAGHKSVLVKYAMINSAYGRSGDQPLVSLFSLRVEANYKLVDTAFKPVEVTFAWGEIQADYSTVMRSHTQLVEKVPFTYTINVGGADHPTVKSLQISLKGAAGEAKYGYSDGKDNAEAKKHVDRFVTYGRNFALGKPYTVSVPSMTNWESGDPEGKKLTDGFVGPNQSGGVFNSHGLLWDQKSTPEIVVDLGKAESCGAFRIQMGSGWPWWDALKGENQDQVEVLVSEDNKTFASAGKFNLKLRRKDMPVNFMAPDNEALTGYNYELLLDKPVQARYVKYKLQPARMVNVTEVQVFDGIKYEPFDLKLALPDGQDRSDITKYNPKRVVTKEGMPEK